MSKILVTGGAGMIGSHLVDKLVEHGHEVYVADNLSRGVKENINPKANFLYGDLSSPKVCGRIFGTARPDLVYHLAAVIGGVNFMHTEQAHAYYNNTMVNTNTLRSAAAMNIPYLYTSTACIYPLGLQEYTSHKRLSEKDDLPADPESCYGWSKLAHEQYCKAVSKETGLRIVIVRPFNVYGPREPLDPKKGHVIPSLLYKVIKDPNLVVWGTGNQIRSFQWVGDAVEGIMAAMDKAPSADPINLGSGDVISIRDLAVTIMAIHSRETNTAFRPITFDPSMPEGVAIRSCDFSKAKRLLGWEAKTSLEDGIERTYRWARQSLS